MSSQSKPAAKYQIPEWYTNIYQITTDSQRQRDAAHELRQQARFLMNETDNKAKWDQYDTNTRLQDRIEAKRRWRDILEQTLVDLDKEMTALNIEKEHLEEKLFRLNIDTDVNTENLTLRDSREGIENTADGTEIELTKEQEMIAKCKKRLQQMIDEAFEELALLQEARHQLVADLQDKNIEMKIDIDCYNLNDWSPLISYKPFVPRRPKHTTTPQQWDDFSRYNVDRGRAEIIAAQRLREAMHALLHGVDNDMDAQHNATDYEMRKRIRELEKARDELEWQKKNIEDEIEALNKDIHNIEEAIMAKIPKEKKAETRLEWRTWRPNVEMCWDAAHVGLIDELQQLKATKAALNEKLHQLRHCLDNCEKQLYRINDELTQKKKTLTLDDRCQQTREKLYKHPMTQADCNLLKQGIITETSKVILP